MTTIQSKWYSGASFESLKGVDGEVSGAEKIVDLKGAKLSIDEVFLDVSAHSYLIRNGTLTDGSIIIGPPTRARRVKFANVNLERVSVTCVEELRADLEFIECFGVSRCTIQADTVRFIRCKMLENTELQARKLTVEDCWGLRCDELTTLVVADEVRVTSSESSPRAKIRNVEFKGTGGKLMLDRTGVRGSRLRGSFERVSFMHADFDNCSIRGSCADWRETEVVHRADRKGGGDWNPVLNGPLKLHDVTFETVTVDTATLANFCEDLRTVDIQNARVDSEWEVLRDNYSGTLLAFHLLFLLAFVAPLATKLVVYAGAAGANFGAVGLGADDWDYEIVWRVLLFGLYDHGTLTGWLHAGLTFALLVYNVGRVYLTVTIVKLRAREEHLSAQRFRRARPAGRRYRLKYLVHQWVMGPLFWLALVSALWKVWDAISLKIPVPPGV